MREITSKEVNSVAGAGTLPIGNVQEFYPELLPGYEIVGWSMEIVDYDTVTTYEKGGFWTPTTITHIYCPVFDFHPIYAPLSQPVLVI